VASGLARNAWRQIIHNLTSNPLEREIVKEQLRITDEFVDVANEAAKSGLSFPEHR
jgi:hypothetical protein